MADYFTHFSCLIDVGTPDKAACALALQRDKQDENLASIRMRTRGWCLAGRA
jgi:hypothetical protein